MNKETESIKNNFIRVLSGEPWYGRPVYEIMEEVKPGTEYQKPNDHTHSLIELLYHMITWADFTLAKLEKDNRDIKAIESLDWRPIDPAVHNWQKGLQEFKSTHQRIIELLDDRDDDFLNEPLTDRDYDFRFLLNGLIQHDIYHLGQIVILTNLQSQV